MARHGQLNENTGKVEVRNVRKAKQRELGKVTVYDTKAKRAARALWG